MDRKISSVVTITSLIIASPVIITSYYLPEADAPQLRLTMYDADGVQVIQFGETAEYLIKVENIGKTRGYVRMSYNGGAEGWESSISHEDIHLDKGEYQMVTLSVKAVSTDAAPSVDVNILASRGNNVTKTGTTTYLKGDVQIRKSGTEDWIAFGTGEEMTENDDVKTGENSETQIDIGDYLKIILQPESEIHCRLSNELDGALTFEFTLISGSASFSLELPGNTSMFILNLDGGAMAKVNSTLKTTFYAQSGGFVKTYTGTVYYTASPGRQGEGQEKILTPGTDSLDRIFSFAMLDYPGTIVSGIVKDKNGATLGFDNTGSYIATGDLDGFVFKFTDRDYFFINDQGSDPLNIDLATVSIGDFDIHYMTYDRGPAVGFIYKDMKTPSKGTVTFTFEEFASFITSSSEITYDLEIQDMDASKFSADEVTLKADQGQSFEILNREHLANPEVNSVRFGVDDDGDGTVDQSTKIHNGMTGDEIKEALEEEDEDNDFFIFCLSGFAIVFFIGIMILILKSGGMDTFLGRSSGEVGEGPESLEKEKVPEMDTVPEESDEIPSDGSETDDVKGESGSMNDIQGLVDEREESRESLTGGLSSMLPSDVKQEFPPQEDEDIQEREEGAGIDHAQDLLERNKGLILEEEYEELDKQDIVDEDHLADDIPTGDAEKKESDTWDDEGSLSDEQKDEMDSIEESLTDERPDEPFTEGDGIEGPGSDADDLADQNTETQDVEKQADDVEGSIEPADGGDTGETTSGEGPVSYTDLEDVPTPEDLQNKVKAIVKHMEESMESVHEDLDEMLEE